MFPEDHVVEAQPSWAHRWAAAGPAREVTLGTSLPRRGFSLLPCLLLSTWLPIYFIFSSIAATGRRGFAACVFSSCAHPCRALGPGERCGPQDRLGTAPVPMGWCGCASCAVLANNWTFLLCVVAVGFTSLSSSVFSCEWTVTLMKPLWVFFCNKWCWSQPGCCHNGYFASPVQPAIGFGV